MTDTNEIFFSIRSDIIGKPSDSAVLSTLADGWKVQSTDDPSKLLDALGGKGWAIAPGVYKDGTKKKDNFLRGQIYLADFDGTMSLEEAKQNPYLLKHFIGLYTTASHGNGKGDRFRAIGIFPEPFSKSEDYDRAVRAIRATLPGQDPAMGCAQASFGNPGAETYLFDAVNRLPIPPVEQPPSVPRATHSPLDLVKAKACLKVIPPRSGKGTGTYQDAIEVVMALVHEFGQDVALDLIDEMGWDDPAAEDWNIESKLSSVANHTGNSLGLGTVIQIARRHAAADPALAAQLERELTGSRGHETPLQELMNQLLDISCNVDDPQRWAKAKLIEADIRKLGVSSKDIQRQKMAMLSARLGLDTAGVNGVKNSIRKLGRSASNRSQQWLLPNFFPKAKAAMLYGDSGVGKTSIALHIANSYINGLPFADSVYPAVSDNRKVLFIASDGQGDAYDHLEDYAEQSGFLDDQRFVDHFDVYAASEEDASGPFNFSEVHLVNLHQKLQSGEYGLVFIDSLKAACMGSDFSIDDRTVAEPMRLVQAMCAKTDTTLIWLHHTNKSSSGSSHRAGGSTDVIEIISAAHELRHTWDEKTESGSTEWIVQKVRGSSKRRFAYSFDFETGVVLHDCEPEPASTADLILRAIYESEYKRLSRESIAQRINKNPKTLSNHATHLKNEGLIRLHRTAWELTAKGKLAAKEFQPLPSFFPSHSDF